MRPDSARPPAWFRRRGSVRVIPAERWQRALGWLVDVLPFAAVGGGLVFWLEGPDFVLTGLRSLLGLSGGSVAASSTPAIANHSVVGDLLADLR